MTTSGAIIRDAFDGWMSGTGHIADSFAPDLTGEIVGHSEASATDATAQELEDKVLVPFAQRFNPDKPFRPVNIRGFYGDGDNVIVIWDGVGPLSSTLSTRTPTPES
jgi:hypothetical protein